MFLQRNTAGQVFTLPGTLRDTSGAAVTSGASLTWVKDGSSGAAVGTLTHVSDGGYTYQPTQGETDAAICGWVLSKTGAIGLAGSVRTTNANPNDGTRLGLTALPNAAANANGGLPILSSAGTTLAYTISTLTTYTGNTPQTGDVYAQLPANFSTLTIANNGVSVNPNQLFTSFAYASTSMGNAIKKINDGSLSDPWNTVLPGAYASGRAGYILGTYLDAAVTSRPAGSDWTSTRAGYLDNLSGGAVALAGSAPAWYAAPLSAVGTRSALGLGAANMDTQFNAIYTVAGLVQAQTDKLLFDGHSYVRANMMAVNTATTAINTGGAGVVTFLDNATVCTVGTLMPANVVQVNGETVAEDGNGHQIVYAEKYYDTNTDSYVYFDIPAAAADPWGTALPGAYGPGTAGHIVGANLDAAVSAVQADVAAVKADTASLLTRVTATLFSGITSLAQWLGLLAGKQAGDDTARTELRATGVGSGTFDETTDSLEALGEGGGAAPPADVAAAVWDLATAGHTTAGTFGAALVNLPVVAPSWYSEPLDAAGVRAAVGLAEADLDEQLAGLAGGGGASPDAVAAAVMASRVLEIQTPSTHMVDAAGNQLTAVTARQALAALMVTLTGDRDGVGTRTIVATVPGAEDCTVTAHRETRSTIDATIVVPTTPD